MNNDTTEDNKKSTTKEDNKKSTTKEDDFKNISKTVTLRKHLVVLDTNKILDSLPNNPFGNVLHDILAYSIEQICFQTLNNTLRSLEDYKKNHSNNIILYKNMCYRSKSKITDICYACPLLREHLV